MSKMKFTALGLLISCSGLAQETYVKVYDFPVVPVIGYNVQEYEGRIYTIASLFCDLQVNFVECSFLSELNLNGDTLWTTLIPDIDVASGTMVIVNDTITVTGNNESLKAWRMAHFDLNGQKLGETIEIEHPQRKFSNMFQLTTQYFNDKYVICGSGWEEDTIWSLLFIVDKQGEIDTLISLEGCDRLSACWHSYIDNEGRLTTYHQVEFSRPPGPGPPRINYRRIFKFDTNYDTVWTYRSENSESNDVVPRGCQLEDGRTILSYTNPEQERNIHSVRAINPDGTKDWQHNYIVTGSRNRYILRLITLANGDIMGSGYYGEKAGDPRIDHSPWLFRMSPEGALLWEKVYYDYDSTITSNGSSRIGSIFDFIELEDGSILGVGDLKYNSKSSMLVIRVDSNGCLDPEDCQEIVVMDLLTNADEPNPEISTLLFFPNPVEDILHISYEAAIYEIDVHIIDVTARIITRGKLINGEGSISTSHFSEGLYFIQLQNNGKLLAKGKFIKTGK